MRTSTLRLAIAALAFLVACGGALLVLSGDGAGSTGTRGDGGRDGGSARQSATSDIWSVGDAWTVRVRQDAGDITPDGATSIAVIPYRFKVAAAPSAPTDAWTVTVHQDGAEGPFADGWRLLYRDVQGVMQLHRVAMGDQEPMEAELASIVLGLGFPYEVSYRAAPRDRTIDADTLFARSKLPPASLPDGGSDGAAPPADSPAPPVGAPEHRG